MVKFPTIQEEEQWAKSARNIADSMSSAILHPVFHSSFILNSVWIEVLEILLLIPEFKQYEDICEKIFEEVKETCWKPDDVLPKVKDVCNNLMVLLFLPWESDMLKKRYKRQVDFLNQRGGTLTTDPTPAFYRKVSETVRAHLQIHLNAVKEFEKNMQEHLKEKSTLQDVNYKKRLIPLQNLKAKILATLRYLLFPHH